MKQILKIATLIFLMAFVRTGAAIGLGGGGKNPEASDVQEQQQPTDGKKNTQKPIENTTDPESGLEGEGNKIKNDSVQDDSISKYNFIFYFLYKFKYDEEDGL